jgi:hypothetical protein
MLVIYSTNHLNLLVQTNLVFYIITFTVIQIVNMIYQLSNGRIIELSFEQFLELDDNDIKELNGIGSVYSLECNDPFYNLFSDTKTDKEIAEELLDDEEFEPDLFDLINFDTAQKMEYDDECFYSDDI